MPAVISYCIPCWRPVYARLLIDDLIRKTAAPYEILLWLNMEDGAFEEFLGAKVLEGRPVRIVGKSPENRGMAVLKELMEAAKHRMIVQIDDDVVRVSAGIAEYAEDVFRRHPKVRQLTADVWQDEYVTGARPPLSAYRAYDEKDGLLDGPIDGWFSVYHRDLMPLIRTLIPGEYWGLGNEVQGFLPRLGYKGLLCTKFKVFHVNSPQYAHHFGMLDFETEKYRRLGRIDLVREYEKAKAAMPPAGELEARVAAIAAVIDGFRP